MEKHIKILGVLNIVWGSLGAIAGLIVLLIFGTAYGIVGVVIHREPQLHFLLLPWSAGL